ncbi:MAG: pyridoxamine 5'-phosphate oxidase family protein [Candidatus Dojkabacteria bacterium]
MDKKQIVIDFIKNHGFCVISSNSAEGFPQSAVLSYSEFDGTNIIVSTSSKTRKYKNIKENPKTSIVIGWSTDDFLTLQMDGETTEAEDQQKAGDIHCAKNEYAKNFRNDPDNKYLIFKPTWIRFTDLKTKEVFEL